MDTAGDQEEKITNLVQFSTSSKKPKQVGKV